MNKRKLILILLPLLIWAYFWMLLSPWAVAELRKLIESR